MKLAQTEFSSNVVPNIFYCPWSIISGDYLPQFTSIVHPKGYLSQVGVSSNIGRNTHLVSMKSYLVIIGPNSFEKLNEIR